MWRFNARVGISDNMWILFGDEILLDFVSKLSAMPFFILAAKLCPSGVEASMFSLFMGLSNFGSCARAAAQTTIEMLPSV